MDLQAVVGTASAAGDLPPHGLLLSRLAEAVLRGDEGDIAAVRSALRTALGDAGLVDALAVVAAFNAIDRVADATGIPLDKATHQATADMRASLGIDAFRANHADDSADPPAPEQG